MNLRIVAAQLNFTVGDTAGNKALIEEAVQRARDELGAQLIVFPELAITGYPPEDLLFRQAYLDEVELALESLVNQAQGITILIAHPQQTPIGLCNALSVFQNKEWLLTYQKQCLPNTQVFDEKRYFEPGREAACFTFQGIKIGLLICEDIWHAEPLERVKQLDPDLILISNASPFSADKMASRYTLLRAQAKSVHLPMIYVNHMGAQDELIFDGGSFAVNQQGEIVSQAPVFEETLWPIDCIWENEQISIPPQTIIPLPPLEESVYQAVLTGVRDYYHKNKFNGVILGLSGGIDSALVLAMAVDAIGADKVEALLMPSRYTSDLSNDLAVEQAKNLGIRYEIMPIESAYEAFLNTLSSRIEDHQPGLTQQNIQARCRGVLLMAVSNTSGALVLTTGNKSEYATGYATLYGDMCGGYAPLKDLSKHWVYRLAKYRNTLSPVIPQAVIDRPPTAELAPNQKDADSLPEYEDLDEILSRYIEHAQGVDQIVEAGFDRAMVQKVTGLIFKNEYKRRQSAPGPKVTNKAFGRDRRYPMTSGFRGKI